MWYAIEHVVICLAVGVAGLVPLSVVYLAACRFLTK